jgi:hypothetical protein
MGALTFNAVRPRSTVFDQIVTLKDGRKAPTFDLDKTLRKTYEFEADGVKTKITRMIVEDQPHPSPLFEGVGYAAGDFGAPGRWVEQKTIRKDNLRIFGVMEDQGGKSIGRFEFTIDPKTREAFHNGMFMDPGAQGKGFAGKWTSHIGFNYAQNGIEKVGALASDDVGGYAWAARGFQWRYKVPSPTVVQSMDSFTKGNYASIKNGSVDQETIGEVQKMLNGLKRGKVFSPQDLANVGRSKPYISPVSGRQTWAGKEILMGTQWSASMDLREMRKILLAEGLISKAEEVIKHLPGEHDQKTHGNRGAQVAGTISATHKKGLAKLLKGDSRHDTMENAAKWMKSQGGDLPMFAWVDKKGNLLDIDFAAKMRFGSKDVDAEPSKINMAERLNELLYPVHQAHSDSKYRTKKPTDRPQSLYNRVFNRKQPDIEGSSVVIYRPGKNPRFPDHNEVESAWAQGLSGAHFIFPGGQRRGFEFGPGLKEEHIKTFKGYHQTGEGGVFYRDRIKPKTGMSEREAQGAWEKIRSTTPTASDKAERKRMGMDTHMGYDQHLRAIDDSFRYFQGQTRGGLIYYVDGKPANPIYRIEKHYLGRHDQDNHGRREHSDIKEMSGSVGLFKDKSKRPEIAHMLQNRRDERSMSAEISGYEQETGRNFSRDVQNLRRELLQLKETTPNLSSEERKKLDGMASQADELVLSGLIDRNPFDDRKDRVIPPKSSLRTSTRSTSQSAQRRKLDTNLDLGSRSYGGHLGRQGRRRGLEPVRRDPFQQNASNNQLQGTRAWRQNPRSRKER